MQFNANLFIHSFFSIYFAHEVPLRHERVKINKNDTVQLGAWLATQRREHLNLRMKPERLALMQKLVDSGKLEWSPLNHSKQSEQTWPLMYECLKMYCKERQAEHPGVEVSSIPEHRKWHHPNGIEVGLGRWMHTQNKQRRAGKLRPDRLELMEELVEGKLFRWPNQRPAKNGTGIVSAETNRTKASSESDSKSASADDNSSKNTNGKLKVAGVKRPCVPISLESATASDFGVHATVMKNKYLKKSTVQSQFLNTSSRSSDDSAVRSVFSVGSLQSDCSIHSEEYYMMHEEKTTKVPPPLAVEPFSHLVTAEFIAKKADQSDPVISIPFPLPIFQMTQVRDIYLGSVSQEQLTLSKLSVGPVEPHPLFLDVKSSGEFTKNVERKLIAQATAHLINKCDNLGKKDNKEIIPLLPDDLNDSGRKTEDLMDRENLQIILRGIAQTLAERAEMCM